MQVFEFHFNPGDKNRLIFDSFCYIPENIYEKRMGGIFMLAELKSPLPHNYKLLEKTASAVKKEFYLKFHRTHEQALKESLKRGNEVLSAEVAKENTDWLGNLNFAIISLKNFDLNFTKIGAIKMFLLRGPHVIDIGSKLDSQEIEPYPLKIFNNIVSGRLAENDIILLFSEAIFPALKNIINEIAEILPFDENKLKNFIKTKEKELADISGAFIVINVIKQPATLRRPKIIFQREAEKFQMGQALSPILQYSKKSTAFLRNIPILITFFLKKYKKAPSPEPIPPKNSPVKIKVKVEEHKPKSKNKLPSFKIPSFRFNLPALRAPTLKIPTLKLPVFNLRKNNIIFRKKFLPILLFLSLLAVGFMIFQGQEKQKQKEYLLSLQTIREKVSQAENFMILKDTNSDAKKQALLLLSAAWDEIIPATKLSGQIKVEALSLKEIIDNDLKVLNNLVKVEEPELVFEFNKQEFIPQKIIYDEKNLYLFSPYVQNIFKIDENKNGQIVRENQKFSKASADESGHVFLFAKPDILTLIENSQINEKITLKLPYSGFNPIDFTTFKGSAYFLDAETAEIIRYLSPLTNNKENPLKWLRSDVQKPLGAKSLAVDGSVWALDKDNNFLRYYAGNLQQTIIPSVFPEIKSFSKILIPFGSPHIFALEPAQNRVVIFDKQGKVIRQFESEKFDSLLDFAVSQKENTIWLLNAQRVYKINL